MSARQIFAASTDDGCAVRFFILILVIIFIIMLLSLDGEQTPPSPLATLSPGVQILGQPTQPIPPGTLIYPCQPGVAVDKTIHVAYTSVFMRRASGYVGKDDAEDAVGYLQEGDRVVVKGGPEIKDGLCWWFVEHEGKQGWTADHSRDGRLLLKASP